MNFKTLCTGIFAGCLFSTVLNAEPMHINPFPDTTRAESTEPENESLQSRPMVNEKVPGDAPVEQHSDEKETKIKLLSSWAVPQPGDSYFDPPSPSLLSSRVEDGAVTDMPKAAETLESLESGDKISPGTVAEPAAENLRMRMSESFDDMVVEKAAQQKAVEHKREPQPVKKSEKITWTSPRVVPKQPVKMPAVELPKPVDEVKPAPVAAQAALKAQGETDDLVAPPVMKNGLKWQAQEGAGIRQVLENWAKREGADLIWDSRDEFTVLEKLETSGPFHGAVKSLLDQYQDKERRPVATLHVNPENSEKTLIVRALDGA